ncbi:HNH endonuclease signature motif containing protein [Streptomyces sp. NPDC020667]|uniref:HNH endonuclease signature motif containing protein n=1 Tax=Streptomyces sp. NPDC020667 TaxID=3154895 RepID=UPI0033E4AD3F
MGTAWLVLAVGEDLSRGGNDGYDDNPSEHYSWDSRVPHSGDLKPGDVIALWDKRALLGLSVIERIDIAQAVKNTYTCPHCNKADFKPRVRKKPRYLCKCGKEFEDSVARRTSVTAYRSSHAAAWVDMPGILDGRTLRQLCDSPGSQLSMRPMHWEVLREAIARTGAPTTVQIADTAHRAIHGGHRQAVVRARVGQAAFRRQLLETLGEVCAFTGPAPAAALEAAHLYSYATSGEHHSEGGLLLRRDIHRLFDLGLIAVNPATLTADVAGRLRPFPVYAALHGSSLTVPLKARHRTWLEAHWAFHRTGEPGAAGAAQAGDSGLGGA